jgi:predicted histone-like DNA-binding protein
MTVKFNIVERGRPGHSEAPKKYYPSLQSTGRVSVHELAERASRRSALSTPVMIAAIETLLDIIPDELAQGNIVELGDFGNFWLRFSAEGVEDIARVRGEQITSLLPRFNPGKRFKQALAGVEFERLRRKVRKIAR